MSISSHEGFSEQQSISLASHWQALPGTHLSWRDWGEDEVAVYSHNLGHSYLLNADAWQVMSLLYQAHTALAVPVLIANLRLQYASETTDQEIHGLVAAVLPELHRIGLAQPAA